MTFLFLCVIGFSQQPDLSLKSSDKALVKIFNWAKTKALSYAHTDAPVGPWYEAALPKREAFCVRDVSHQSIGASILGLNAHNKNMFLKFVENISESKDFCTYWEINKYNNPAPIDFRNDNDFWYNLPANFDLIDACYRQYLWTGDEDYIENNYFTTFYDLSLNEYVKRWELSPDKVLKRDRFINMIEPKVKSNSYYYTNRGIPGYNEGGKGVMKLGIDLTASHISALKAMVEINRIQGNTEEQARYSSQLKEYNKFLNDVWWDAEKEAFKTILYEDGSVDYAMVESNQAYSHYLLHFRSIKNKKQIKSIIETYKENKDKIIIELASHLSLIFFNYGNPKDGYEMLSIVSDENNKRRDYPENSFSIIESITLGLMGVRPNAETKMVETLSRMPIEDQWVELKNINVLSNNISVKHEGWVKTFFVNKSPLPITWRSRFFGKHETINVNGQVKKAKIGYDDLGRIYSYIDTIALENKTMIAYVE